MKRIFKTFIFLIIFVLVFTYREEIVKTVVKTYTQYETINLPDSNVYSDDFNFELVKRTEDFHVKSYQHMLNIIYNQIYLLIN